MTEKNGILIVNSNTFLEKELKKAGYDHNPLDADELAQYRVFSLPLTELTLNAVKELGLSHSQATKCKNFFALGVIFWLYSRPLEHTLTWLTNKFKQRPEVAKANRAALQAGFNYALTTELFTEQYTVKKAAAYNQATTAKLPAMKP